MDLAIKGGTVVVEDIQQRIDIGVTDGKISEMGEDLHADKEIDAQGLLVFPGGVDAQVQFIGRSPNNDLFKSSTMAAAAGGTTTIIDLAIQNDKESVQGSIDRSIKEVEGKACIDFGLHAQLNRWDRSILDEIPSVIDSGTPSIMTHMFKEGDGFVVNKEILSEILKATKGLGAMVLVHAESPRVIGPLVQTFHNKEDMKRHGAFCHSLIRPKKAEEEAIILVKQVCDAQKANACLTHISTKEGAVLLARAKDMGVHIKGETSPQFLLLNQELLKGEEGHLYSSDPPLRDYESSYRLWKAIAEGEIKNISSNSKPYTKADKDKWDGDFTKLPSGLPGVETRLPLLFNYGVQEKRITLKQFVELISTNPAKTFGLYPRKGTLKVGSDADIVVYDPKKEITIDAHYLQTDCDWSPYQGRKVHGWPRYVFCRGEMVAENERYCGKIGSGQYLKRVAEKK